MNTPRTRSQATIDAHSLGALLGERYFRSFLLAGERNIVQGLNREGTDEARFASFYDRLPGDMQLQVKSYFQQQAGFASPKRQRLLGPLSAVSSEQVLTTATTARDLIAEFEGLARFGNMHSATSHAKRHVGNAATDQRIPSISASGHGLTLSLHLDSLRVDESQDDWLFGRRNTTDEVRLAVMTVNPRGIIKMKHHNLGDIQERQKMPFNGKRLARLAQGVGGDDWPKRWSCVVYAWERDGGRKQNKALDAAVEHIRSVVSKEMIEDAVEAKSKGKLPPEVVEAIASTAKSFLDGAFAWLAGLLRNDNDQLGSHQKDVEFTQPSLTWRSTGTSRSEQWAWQFKGSGGQWTTTMHWRLSS